ncbi:ParA family protein [Desulfohalovibrio reitneri]|uniref:ParA family protein n=1 Tax=Desulfohalovibrio reitneri TaxID=1307759 RepID=UPI0004A725F1|nr:AAA family ATPase [Desulfohalovibrio reitneri]
MRTIAVMNQKGGVGKTTTTINIGAGLARLDQRVLLVDLDPQAHLTYSLGIPAHELEATIYEVLKGEADVASTLLERHGMDVLPSSLSLSGADLEFSALPGREFLLREALEGFHEMSRYDYVLVDCPPNLGILTINAMTAAREVFIPLQTEFLALQSLSKLLETVEVVKKRLNPSLEVTGIVATRYQKQKKLSREVVRKIRDYFGDKLFESSVRENISLAEAPSFGQDIFTYRPDSHGAMDYMALCREIQRSQRHAHA